MGLSLTWHRWLRKKTNLSRIHVRFTPDKRLCAVELALAGVAQCQLWQESFSLAGALQAGQLPGGEEPLPLSSRKMVISSKATHSHKAPRGQPMRQEPAGWEQWAGSSTGRAGGCSGLQFWGHCRMSYLT